MQAPGGSRRGPRERLRARRLARRRCPTPRQGGRMLEEFQTWRRLSAAAAGPYDIFAGLLAEASEDGAVHAARQRPAQVRRLADASAKADWAGTTILGGERRRSRCAEIKERHERIGALGQRRPRPDAAAPTTSIDRLDLWIYPLLLGHRASASSPRATVPGARSAGRRRTAASREALIHAVYEHAGTPAYGEMGRRDLRAPGRGRACSSRRGRCLRGCRARQAWTSGSSSAYFRAVASPSGYWPVKQASQWRSRGPPIAS